MRDLRLVGALCVAVARARGSAILGANLQAGAMAMGSQGGLYAQISPPAPHPLPPSPPQLPGSSPPTRRNVRHLFSFGSVSVVLLFGSGLMIAVYLRRGIVLSQESVVNIIKDTPSPFNAAKTIDDFEPSLPPLKRPDDSTPPNPHSMALPSAMVTVPLGVGATPGGWTGAQNARKQYERTSLLSP